MLVIELYLCWHGNIKTNIYTPIFIPTSSVFRVNVSMQTPYFKCHQPSTPNASIRLNWHMHNKITNSGSIRFILVAHLKMKLKKRAYSWKGAIFVCGVHLWKNAGFLCVCVFHCENAIEIGFTAEIYDRIRRNFCVSNCVLLAIYIVSLG